MSDTTAQPEVFEYQAEMQKLLDILVHSLYTEREIFLRELISNASDALSKVQFTTLTESEVADKDADLDIRIAFDDQANTIEVIDSGCGMTREELVQNLGTIASSGTLRFLQEAKDRNQSAENLIGQFGVGFYSVFMIAQKVEVTTRSWRPDAQGWQWTSEGSGSYTLAPKEVSSRGTRILLRLKEDAKEFCKEYQIENIVKKYSNYVPFPVKLKGRTLNQVKALWTQPKSEVEDKEYDEFYKQITHDHQTPLHRLHFSIDAPIQFHALLYVPEKVTNEVRYAKEGLGLALYAQKVMIEPGNTKLLPTYLRFVRGVVDSEDLPLNVSRESVRQNALIERIKKTLTKQITHDHQTPLHRLHFSIDAPIQFHALLYVPEKVTNEVRYAKEGLGLALYAQKVMIEPGNTKLLPTYLRFVRGVVDSEDLPLNVSRESVRQNALIERIKKTLTSRLIKDLGSVAENNADLYEKFWKQFGIFLKEGAATDFSNREKLADLLRFNSTLLEDSEPQTTLKDYVSRMREEQQEIFYAVGSTRESLQLHPNLEYFRKQGYEVLFLFDQFDDYLMSELKEYSGKPLKSISQAEVSGLDTTETEGETLSKEESQDVLGLFETQLKDRVEKVVESKRLVDSPCSLVDGRDGTSVQMERMMRMMDQEFQASKRTLEINLRHPLIKNLSTLVQQSKSDPFLEDAVEQLYANALLVEGLLENPVEMLPRVHRFLTDAAAHRIGAGAA